MWLAGRGHPDSFNATVFSHFEKTCVSDTGKRTVDPVEGRMPRLGAAHHALEAPVGVPVPGGILFVGGARHVKPTPVTAAVARLDDDGRIVPRNGTGNMKNGGKRCPEAACAAHSNQEWALRRRLLSGGSKRVRKFLQLSAIERSSQCVCGALVFDRWRTKKGKGKETFAPGLAGNFADGRHVADPSHTWRENPFSSILAYR